MWAEEEATRKQVLFSNSQLPNTTGHMGRPSTHRVSYSTHCSAIFLKLLFQINMVLCTIFPLLLSFMLHFTQNWFHQQTRAYLLTHKVLEIDPCCPWALTACFVSGCLTCTEKIPSKMEVTSVKEK